MEIDTTRFAALLRERRERLLSVAESDREAAATVELDQARVGRLSRMDALQAQAMSAETGQRRRDEVRRIEAALARIEAGEYGYCLRCDQPIGAARLEVDPAATLCIGCASAAEQAR